MASAEKVEPRLAFIQARVQKAFDNLKPDRFAKAFADAETQ
jgi:hypothetical protein